MKSFFQGWIKRRQTAMMCCPTAMGRESTLTFFGLAKGYCPVRVS